MTGMCVTEALPFLKGLDLYNKGKEQLFVFLSFLKRDLGRSFFRIFILFAGWRMLLFLLFFLSQAFFQNASAKPGDSGIWYAHLNGDGLGYLRIAQFGYHGACSIAGNITPLRLFPLYPLLVRVLSYVFFGNLLAAGIFISSACTFAALIFLWKLVSMDEREEIADRTLLLLLVFPGSIFLAACYSESLFLLTLLASVYEARRGRWVRAGVYGMFCSLAHPTGILATLFLSFEYLKQRGFSVRRVRLSACSLILVPLGSVFYMIYLYCAHGNPFLFINAQEMAVQRGFNILLYRPLLRAIRVMANNPLTEPISAITTVNLMLLILFIFLTVMAIRGLRSTYAFVMAVFIAVILMTDSRSFPLVSMSRMLLPLFPAFILPARVRDIFFRGLYVACSSLLLGLLGAVFSSGRFFVA